MLQKQLLFGFFKTAIFWHKGFVCYFLETQDAPSLILWMKLQLQPMFICVRIPRKPKLSCCHVSRIFYVHFPRLNKASGFCIDFLIT